MIRLEKIDNKIQKVYGSEGNVFLDIPRAVTFTEIEGGLGYIIPNEKDLLLELDTNVILFPCDETEIDGQFFATSQELKDYIFA